MDEDVKKYFESVSARLNFLEDLMIKRELGREIPTTPEDRAKFLQNVK